MCKFKNSVNLEENYKNKTYQKHSHTIFFLKCNELDNWGNYKKLCYGKTEAFHLKLANLYCLKNLWPRPVKYLLLKTKS